MRWLRTSSRSWSPGTTGRRSLTRSIEAIKATRACWQVDARADQDPGGLSERLQDEHARHDRQPGPMAREKRFVDAHVLDGHGAAMGLELEHTIDQQERVAVGQRPHDALDVERRALSASARCHRTAGRSGMRCSNKPARQGMVGLVSGAMGDDEPLEVEAQQRQVAEQVEYFVARAFVLVAQRVSDQPLAAEDQEIGRGGPQADAGSREENSPRPR